MALRLQDKLALVTAAGQGIGRAIAHRLASEGAWVAVIDKDARLAEQSAADAPGSAIAVTADITDEHVVAAAIAGVLHTRGALDIVVNVKPNAADAAFRDYRNDLERTLRRVVSERA